jgi:hypothetical protein
MPRKQRSWIVEHGLLEALGKVSTSLVFVNNKQQRLIDKVETHPNRVRCGARVSLIGI